MQEEWVCKIIFDNVRGRKDTERRVDGSTNLNSENLNSEPRIRLQST
jgi:hypothetical protein